MFLRACKQNDQTILTFATEQPNIAEKYFSRKAIVADIITINGSSEKIPKYGCVDVIFDIVENDRAFKENWLAILEEAMPTIPKIFVNKSVFKYD
jgi:ATP phosphoribosyltransferase